MMSEKETKLFKRIYSHLLKGEEAGWTEIDDNLEFFEWLTDRDLLLESELKRQRHTKNGVRCPIEHDRKDCHAPAFLDVVHSIMKLYMKPEGPSGLEIHVQHRYVLMNYIALSEMGLLV